MARTGNCRGCRGCWAYFPGSLRERCCVCHTSTHIQYVTHTQVQTGTLGNHPLHAQHPLHKLGTVSVPRTYP
ncbi:MAG: hypothetical protein GY903_01075 [Fuerstiella sp.]|nr:hypothetical protein [Fuerstiella sp.]MCP4853070.1 hypothetical protein [Fuerstiella sp.]